MKKILLLLTLFICFAACQSQDPKSEKEEIESAKMEEKDTDLEEEEEELDALGRAVKGSLLEHYHKLGTLHENGMLWRLQLVFDIHSADCGASDCYAHHLQLVLPATILKAKEGSFVYNLQVKGCIPEERVLAKSANMKLYEVGEDYHIFYDDEKHWLLLLTDKNAYLYEELMLAILDSKAPYEYLMEILEDPEHELYPYQSKKIVSK